MTRKQRLEAAIEEAARAREEAERLLAKPRPLWSKNNRLARRLDNDTCRICGFSLCVEVHHIVPSGSPIIITRSRELSLKLVYQLTHKMMICRSKCRPLNRASIGANDCIPHHRPVQARLHQSHRIYLAR